MSTQLHYLSQVKQPVLGGGLVGGLRALSSTELKATALAVTGLTNKEIASALGTTYKCVKNLMMRAFLKTGAENRAQLTYWVWTCPEAAGLIKQKLEELQC